MNKETIKKHLEEIESSLNYLSDAVNHLVVKAEANNQMLNSIIDDLNRSKS